jgi:hypothetical protein
MLTSEKHEDYIRILWKFYGDYVIFRLNVEPHHPGLDYEENITKAYGDALVTLGRRPP